MNALTMFVKSLDAATGFHLNAEQRVLKKLTQLAPLADEQLRLRDQRFVVLDTETTGLRPGKGDRVTSLGAVVVENGMVNESKTFYELVDPGRNIPEEISQLTGITNDMVAGKPNLTEVLNRFLPWAGKSVLAGHVMQFDLAFINRHLLTSCGRKLVHTSLDTKQLAEYAFPDTAHYTLEDICSFLAIPCAPRHHALNDALSAARLLEATLSVLDQQGVNSLIELKRFMRCRRMLAPVVSPMEC